MLPPHNSSVSEPNKERFVPLDFIIDAYKNIGFSVVEEKDTPHMIVLSRDDALVFFNSLDNWVDLEFVAEDARSCEAAEDLFIYLAFKYGSDQDNE